MKRKITHTKKRTLPPDHQVRLSDEAYWVTKRSAEKENKSMSEIVMDRHNFKKEHSI